MKKTTHFFRLPLATSIAAVAVGFLGISENASGAAKTWTGTNSGDWQDGANWGGSIPALSGDTFTFPDVTNTTITNLPAAISIGTTVFGGGTYTIGTIGGDSTVTIAGNVTNNATSLQTLNFDINLGTSNRIFQTATGGGDLTLNGNIAGTATGNNGLQKAATAGTLTLSGTSTYTGATTILGGTLVIGSNSALGSSTLRLAGTSTPLTSTTTTATIQTDGNNARTISNPITETGTGGGIFWTIGGSGDITFTGKYGRIGTGGGGILINNTGVTKFSGGIEGGSNGARTIVLRGSGTVVIDTNPITDFAAQTAASSTAMQYGGTSATAGAATSTDTLNFTLNVLSTYTNSTSIQSGKVTLLVDALSGAPGAFGSGTSTVVLGGGNNLGLKAQLLTGAAVTVGRNLEISGDGNNTGVMTLGGSSDHHSIFSGNINAQKSFTVVSAATGSNKLLISGAISGSATKTVTFDNIGNVEFSGAMGAGSVSKTNTGTTLFSGSSAYTGATSVSNGTLLIHGALTGSATTVSGTGVLGGGTLETPGLLRSISVEGGTLSPGGSLASASGLGALNLTNASVAANLDLHDTSTFKLEINTSNLQNDAVIGVNALNLSGIVNLNITDLGGDVPLSDATFKFITYSGIWNGGFFTVGGNTIIDDAQVTIGANTFYLDYDFNDGTPGVSSVALTMVPEPATWVALLGGTGLLLARRRRKF